MEKSVRVGWVATTILHLAFIGVWWVQPPYSHQFRQGVSGERVVQVYFKNEEPKIQDLSGPSVVTPLPETMPAQPSQLNASYSIEESVTLVDVVPSFLPKDASYIPSSELDERPFTDTPIIVPFPDVSLGISKVTGVLILYVGSNGYVDRIEVDESNLPSEFEKAAIDTFLQARMRPGIKDGLPARARMKILVEFEQK